MQRPTVGRPYIARVTTITSSDEQRASNVSLSQYSRDFPSAGAVWIDLTALPPGTDPAAAVVLTAHITDYLFIKQPSRENSRMKNVPLTVALFDTAIVYTVQHYYWFAMLNGNKCKHI
jgi:hypothetical protein